MTLAEAVETIKTYCNGRECSDEGCVFWHGMDLCSLRRIPCAWETPIETNLYDEEEIHKNCTVHLLRNSVTGETSIGWYENE